ncbi:MAG: PIN domain-containing protein [Desulfobacterium sp.]|jgi:predicted nucleic acid-binding protein|nr:PIN domain-containing protein [Desulfobacterium sp.]
MKLLLNTNILLDIALKRQPFVVQAAQVFTTAQHQKFSLYMTATTITDLFYIVRKAKGKDIALAFIEDAVLVGAAEKAGVDVIITRNEPDFQNAAIRALNPGQFLQHYLIVPTTSENSADSTVDSSGNKE